MVRGFRLVSLFLILVVLLASVSNGAATPLPIQTGDFDTIKLSPGAFSAPVGFSASARDSRNPKLDSTMADIAAASKVSILEAVDLARVQSVRLSGNRVHAQIVVRASAVQQVRQAVVQAGGEVTGAGNDDTLIQGWLPVEALNILAARDDVYLIRRPAEAVPMAVNASTEALDDMNATTWHTAGHTGAGVKIGIIDGGFTGYAALRGTELPASVTVKNFVDGESDAQVDGGSPHGTACTEIIHDIAPNATLYLAKIATNVDLSEAVTWLKDTHQVDIISTSLGWYNLTPGDGTGEFANLVSQARAAGILWVTAASNDREAHWGGAYSDPDGDDVHNFNGSQEMNFFGPGDDVNAYVIAAGYPIRVFVRWDDWTDVNQDYDLYLWRWTGSSWGTSPVARSEGFQNGSAGQQPTEAVYYANSAGGIYGFTIQSFISTRNVNFEIFAPKLTRLDELVYARSLSNLADAPGAMTIAALDVNAPYPQEAYSSEGPTNGPGGTAAGGSIKPDLSGFANVSTASYGAGVFNGTSSATPHVAGAAALVLGANPSYTPDQLQSFLQGRAIDMGTPGKDTKFGYGRLHLGDPPGAVNTAPTLSGLPDQALLINTTRNNAIDLWAYASDAQSADNLLTFTIDNTPAAGAGVSLDSNRYIDINPATGWTGQTNVTIRVTDPGSLFNIDTFSVIVSATPVNTMPTLSGLPDQTLLVNTTRNNAIDLWAYASDAQSADNLLTFTIDNTPAASAGVSLDSNRYIDINPATGWTGQTNVTIRVTDPGSLSATDTFSVTVSPAVNTAPTFSGLPDQSLLINTTRNNAIDLWAYANDAESADNLLTFTIDNTPTASAGISLDSNRYIDLNPATGWAGQTNVTIRVRDPGNLSSVDTFAVIVTQQTYTYLPAILKDWPPIIGHTYTASTDDTTLRTNNAVTWYGNYSDFAVGNSTASTANVGVARSILRFDLSSIPAGVTIRSATLQPYLIGSVWSTNQSSNMQITTYRINQPWPASPTWNNFANAHAEGYGSATVTTSFGRYSFDVTALVGGWLNGTWPNYGIMLRGQEGGYINLKIFASANYGASSYRPWLIVEYPDASAAGGSVTIAIPAEPAPGTNRSMFGGWSYEPAPGLEYRLLDK
jgi:uncharacterized protein YhfF